MIIKSLSRRGGIRKLLEYVNREKSGQKPLLWNLLTDRNDLKSIAREFINNQKFLKPRKNGVVLYHEILSLNHLDREKISSAMLLDLAREYIERRAANALAYALPHLNGTNPHVHIVISANHYHRPDKIRISKFRFRQIKQELERYQREKYPELSHSEVQHTPSKGKIKKSRQERELERRTGRQTGLKESIAETLCRTLIQASSLPEFAALVRKQGYTLYQRGNTHGIIHSGTGKKHRFSTLGTDSFYRERLQQWDRAKSRARDIENIQLAKERQFWREQGFRDDIMQVLQAPPETRREQELRRLQSRKRAIRRDR